MWNREMSRGLKLYVQRTFIMDDAEQFLPLYLRFVKGIVDSNDLPLNVSREILQQDAAVESMRSALTKRILDMLGKLAKKGGEDYALFWKEFGQVLKEGPAEDFANKEKIAKLLRFSSTHTDLEEQNQSLEDYVSRMQEKQDKIYYVVAENFNTAKKSPHLEVFRKRKRNRKSCKRRVRHWWSDWARYWKTRLPRFARPPGSPTHPPAWWLETSTWVHKCAVLWRRQGSRYQNQSPYWR